MVVTRGEFGPIKPSEDELPARRELSALVLDASAGDLHIHGLEGQAVPLPVSVLRLLQVGFESLTQNKLVDVHTVPNLISFESSKHRTSLGQNGVSVESAL